MNDDILAMMEEEVSSTATQNLGGSALSAVSILARKMREMEQEIESADQRLKSLKEQYLKLTDQELPAVLEELGIAEMKLDDGSKIKLTQVYGASIPVDRREEAFAWLRENGYDDIIKNTVACSFGRGEDDKASKFTESIRRMGLAPDTKTEVHAMTLKAFVRERVETGGELPMDLFGAFVGQRAVIKNATVKKDK